MSSEVHCATCPLFARSAVCRARALYGNDARLMRYGKSYMAQVSVVSLNVHSSNHYS